MMSSELPDSGERAIELAEEKEPEIILMDIMLSGNLDGIATAGRIQTKHAIPVIYVTAYADEVFDCPGQNDRALRLYR